VPVYKSTKDTRNHPLWQPSLDSLRNIEADEAGRLKAFRARFGRGWDLEAEAEADAAADADSERPSDARASDAEDGAQSLMDLISGFGREEGSADKKETKGKGKGGK